MRIWRGASSEIGSQVSGLLNLDNPRHLQPDLWCMPFFLPPQRRSSPSWQESCTAPSSHPAWQHDSLLYIHQCLLEATPLQTLQDLEPFPIQSSTALSFMFKLLTNGEHTPRGTALHSLAAHNPDGTPRISSHAAALSIRLKVSHNLQLLHYNEISEVEVFSSKLCSEEWSSNTRGTVPRPVTWAMSNGHETE